MKLCIFCLQRANSQEHIVAKWLLKALDQDGQGSFPVVAGYFLEGEGNVSVRNFDSMRFHTPVCRTCNNGWMSTLEAEVQSLISPLVSTDFPCVAPMYFEELKRRGDRLAIWLAKTALTASLALPQAADPKSIFVPSEIKAGRIAEGVRVDVAKAATAGETVALALSREFIVQSGNLPLSARHSLKTLQFSMQLNHLLLRIAISPDAIETPFPNSRGTAFRVYPRSSREVPACYEFPDFVAFINGVYLRTYNGVKYDRFMP